MKLPDKLTYRDAYVPAMKITDKAEAEVYLQALVERRVRVNGECPVEAKRIERQNIGYYSGYYDRETMIRVQELFECAHPVFGKAKDGMLAPEEVFQMGVDLAGNVEGKVVWPGPTTPGERG